MKRLFFSLIILRSLFNSLEGIEMSSDYSLGMGYRYDNLGWEVSSLPSSDVMTKENWKDLQIFQLSGEAEIYLCNHWYLRFQGDYGWLEGGKKSLDEWEPGRTGIREEEWLSASTQGDVYDASGAFGYSFLLFNDRLQMMPLIGYAYNVQHFKDSHYKDKIHLFNLFEDAKSSYTYRWSGPWAGLLVSSAGCYFRTFFEYQIHWTSYRAAIQDNLFDSDEETQKCHHVLGNDFAVGLVYPMDCWTLGLVGNCQFFKGKNGINEHRGDSFRLKSVSWNSFSVMFNLTRSF